MPPLYTFEFGYQAERERKKLISWGLLPGPVFESEDGMFCFWGA